MMLLQKKYQIFRLNIQDQIFGLEVFRSVWMGFKGRQIMKILLILNLILLLMKYLLLALVLLALLPHVIAEKDYTDVVKKLQESIGKAPWKHSAYERLAYIVDTYGPRMWGSVALEQVIYEMASQANKLGFENLKLEEVKNFTKWARGKESLTLYDPRPFPQKLGVIGLGSSISGHVKAEVIVFQTFDELEAAGKDKIAGKIVCFNHPWKDYYNSYEYRVFGASRAAKYEAVAMLVRSVASSSIYSVHAGTQRYDPAQPKIPAAAITVEDAEMFQRMQDRGQKIIVELSLENQMVGNSYSNNLVFEIKGSDFPEQIILAGGHIDSWDTGSQTGANDDGGGFITVFEALRLLKENDLRPKRTIRFIAWSGEEQGSDLQGALQYITLHEKQIEKHVAAFESDEGSSAFYGIGHTGSGKDIVQDVLKNYLSILDAGTYDPDGTMIDNGPLCDRGVVCFKNLIKDTDDHEYYFRYHHTAGDTMSVMDPDDMDSNVVGIASFLYIIADLDKTVRDIK